ncbi:metallophosphoesterase [Clostridium beijerinckii]|uniref:metallophosphoesterase n=1 Tax=Clostridium beijerinckii TaxID=1520 RepID=UPI0019D26EDA|nr:metallophosphoesterase [Clostridium beijerinckii]MBN7576855.1 metallophosphoesterase [Clostridium beijerinckii]MBN7581342.1 metallophosphoesterase [Clostridium beijerinckii]MBN7586635.1 metallophosphoesterase [Clostridium beijerinckii]MBO0522780.1 metallophosphoesterase [Clostridium beijerinckii]
MKILFLHLSDIHITDKANIEPKKIDGIISALEMIKNFDECVIICSGDLTNRSKVNEYKNIKRLLGSILHRIKESYLKDKFIKLLLVPGNHDADFEGITRTGIDIQKYYKDNKIQENIELEIKMFENFFDYSKTNRCFLSDKILDKSVQRFGNYKIQFNLINTALFSTLKPDDKQLHYFPKEKLSSLFKEENVDIAITVMHHSTEWFQWESKTQLENVLHNNSSIIFVGHDHDLKTDRINSGNKSETFICAGGIFNNNDITDACQFNAMILDTCLNAVDIYEFWWDEKNTLFDCNKLYEEEKLDMKNKKLVPNEKFLENFKQDEKRKIIRENDFTKYFVFPKMIVEHESEYVTTKEINNEDDFFKILYDKKSINIVGGDIYGKTTVLKNIYISLINKKIPLFFSVIDMDGNRIDKIVKRVFEDQYSDKNVEYVKYQQISKTEKVAIIDDFDLIKSDGRKKQLIDLFRTEFEYIIISTSKQVEVDVLNAVRNEINNKEKFYILKIDNFYLNKRSELIKKVCEATQQNSTENTINIDSIINKSIKNNIELFDLNPDFIIQYTQFILQNINYQDQKGEQFLNQVFIANITTSLIENTTNEKIDEMIILLEEIAYYMHFNKKELIGLDEVETIIKRFQKEFGGEVKPTELIDVACKAKIVKQPNGRFAIRFCNKNQLAFFIARSLNRRFNVFGTMEDIKSILKNICFGINDNVILFLSYITSNPQIIMFIHKYAEDLMSVWNEMDIDDGNIEFLSKVPDLGKVAPPKTGDKEKSDKREEKHEENIKGNQILECVNIYDYDESKIDEPQYKIIRAVKYTEMICKALPALSIILTNSNKEKLVQSIYEYPNKIIYNMLKPIDDKYDELIAELREFANLNNSTNENDEELTEEDINIILKNIALILVLSIYDRFAYLSTSKKSIPFLEKYNLSNSNYKLFSLLVKVNSNDIDEVIRKAEKVFDNSKNKDVRWMIRTIIKKELVNNIKIDQGKRQKLLNKYFSADEQKEFLIEQYKKINLK